MKTGQRIASIRRHCRRLLARLTGKPVTWRDRDSARKAAPKRTAVWRRDRLLTDRATHAGGWCRVYALRATCPFCGAPLVCHMHWKSDGRAGVWTHGRDVVLHCSSEGTCPSIDCGWMCNGVSDACTVAHVSWLVAQRPKANEKGSTAHG